MAISFDCFLPENYLLMKIVKALDESCMVVISISLSGIIIAVIGALIINYKSSF